MNVLRRLPAPALSLAWLLALAAPAAAADIVPAENLVTDGLPRLDASIASTAGPYNEIRSAIMLGWYPDRRSLLIATRFADTAQIHSVAMPGGARRQLTFFPDRVSGAVLPPRPPAGDHFVFSKDIGGNEFFQLYRYDLPGGKITLLTDGKSRNSLGPYSRDGKRLAYTSTRRNGRDTDLYVVDPREPKSDRLLAELKGGGWSALDWAPDGKKLLVSESISVSESYLWLVDSESGAKELITPRGAHKIRFEGGQISNDGLSLFTATDGVGEFLTLVRFEIAPKKITPISGAIKWDVDSFDLSPDGKILAAVTNEDGTGVVHLFDARSGRELPRPKLPPGSASSPEWHPNSRDLAFMLSSARSPADVFSLDARSGKVERWTESETGGVDETTTREPELVKWPSFDGRVISGYLYPPPARFTGKRPVIISIHGGPEAQFRPGFPGRMRYLTNELGVALLHPNVRGSTGYGKTFHQLDNGEKREDSVKDIGALLDWIKTRPDLDADRVMVMGGSYGGYMTFASSVHFADRIRASLSVVGISHFVSFLERTEAYRRDLRRVEYGDEREPAMRAFLERISPLAQVGKIKRPIFIAQGKNDPRVPASEAEQILATLKKQKTPVWYLLAKDEGHGFAKKKNADFLFFATVAFVKAHLLESGTGTGTGTGTR
jgi:dipeptidyl aminopeptidase/acylaminoacyl peptidase